MNQEGKKSARQWALRALARRMHTAHEIRMGLLRRGFSDGIAGDIVDDLSRMGYINDLDFARAWVTSRSVHQMHGRLRLLRDLAVKGIPDEMAEQVLKELLPDEDEVAIATRAAEKKLRTMKTGGKTTGSAMEAKSRERVYRYLRSRGYTTRVISLAMAGFTFEEDPS